MIIRPDANFSFEFAPATHDSMINQSLRTIDVDNNVTAMMCPNCFHMRFIKIDLTEQDTSFVRSYDAGYFGENPLHVRLDIQPQAMCPKCMKTGRESWMVPIDPMIAPAVQMLNKKGYHTAYCCQGHLGYFMNVVSGKNAYKITGMSKPYVMFQDNVWLPEGTKPVGWDFDPETDHCHYLQYDTENDKAMNEFCETWAGENRTTALSEGEMRRAFCIHNELLYMNAVNLTRWVEKLPPMNYDTPDMARRLMKGLI